MSKPQALRLMPIAKRLGLWEDDVVPKVLRGSGFRVVIYSNDHRPAHVHAMSAEGEAVFVLNCPDGPLELREIYRVGRRVASALRAWLAPRLPTLCDRWREIHGRF